MADSNMDDMNSRISSLERTTGGLESDVRNLTKIVQDLADSFGDFSRTFSDRVASQNRTNWGVLAGWATVIISILSVLGFLTITPITQSMVRMEDWMFKHQATPSHVGAGERLKALEREVFNGRSGCEGYSR